MLKWVFLAGLAVLVTNGGASQPLTVQSPNQRILVTVAPEASGGSWSLQVRYQGGGWSREVLPQIALGLVRRDQDFSRGLRFLRADGPTHLQEAYTMLHGKRSQCGNEANQLVVGFENARQTRLNLCVRAYNDGVAFRYEFPDSGDSVVVLDELTAYRIPARARRWLEPWDPANEHLYQGLLGDSVQRDWGYPALFCLPDTSCWFLLHEADVNRSYCGSKLSNTLDRSAYKITYPDAADGSGAGASNPTIPLPWRSPWRVIMLGSLAEIVASTLVDDVSPASVLTHTDWIKPGLVSWNYWSNNHGTKDFRVVCAFADLAAEMHWPYTLLDWEWDAMGNGGGMEDAIRVILTKGVRPLLWYNSGVHPWMTATPIDRMRTHEHRLEEFAKLRRLGVAGVKVDFFMSEKQDMIRYYLDILEDAAQAEIMVYFHGCLVPRGWARTYPHLMTYEGVRGAEWYNNGPEFTATAPAHNTILPFTRNVVGAMDYTPVTFTNSQYPHTTSFGHELALSVVFESGLQHLADRPEGYASLPDPARVFLKQVPNAWDDTRLISGEPGKEIVLARRKGNAWYLGGLNAEQVEKSRSVPCSFLSEGIRYQLTLIADGKHDRDFAVSSVVVEKSSAIDVHMLRRGGFAASLTPLP